ncbi:hypothetical protein HOK00_10285 [bacterium]|jgi:hypothetical protein|nr:hypothetical protein [bacterium]
MLQLIEEVDGIIKELTNQIKYEIKNFPNMSSEEINKATAKKNKLLDEYFKKESELKNNLSDLDEEQMELVDQSMVLMEERVRDMLKENKKLFSITNASLNTFKKIAEEMPKPKIRPV